MQKELSLLAENKQQQKDELELLEAMRTNEEEFFWEDRGGAFEGENPGVIGIRPTIASKAIR